MRFGLSEAVSGPAREGWQVVDAALGEVTRRFGPRAVAAFALGSLAHGGFCPGVSDVDVAVILSDCDGSTDAEMAGIRSAVAEALGSPLAHRLSIFWSTWAALARGLEGPVEGRFPLVDRIDLVESGLCLGGEDLRTEVRLPAGDARRRGMVLEGVRFMIDKLSVASRDELIRSPRALVARGLREVTKTVLFPVRFLFTLESGIASNNEASIAHFVATRTGPAVHLVRAAGGWRERGIESPDEAERLLAGGIGLLYAELIAAHHAALLSMGLPSPAQQVAAWGRRLGLEVGVREWERRG